MAQGLMQAERKAILAAVDGGKTQRAVAKEFGRSINSVGEIVRGDRSQPASAKHVRPKHLSMEEKVERLVERAAIAARNGCQGHEINLSVLDYEKRIEDTVSELTKQESKRDQLELDLGNMVVNSATEKETDEFLGRINGVEKQIRKLRSAKQSYLLRMGDQKRQDDLWDIRKVSFIERYGCEGEEKLCNTIDRAIENLSKSCHDLKRWKVLIDDQRYQTTGARARPEHVGYAVSQRLIGEGMNQFLHLGGKNHSFLKSSLFETLHPRLDGVSDAIPPLQTEEDRERQLKELIQQKHREMQEQEQQDQQEQ